MLSVSSSLTPLLSLSIVPTYQTKQISKSKKSHITTTFLQRSIEQPCAIFLFWFLVWFVKTPLIIFIIIIILLRQRHGQSSRMFCSVGWLESSNWCVSRDPSTSIPFPWAFVRSSLIRIWKLDNYQCLQQSYPASLRAKIVANTSTPEMNAFAR